MLAYPEMLVEAAKKAGIKVPENTCNYKREDFPHWFVFCNMQCGASMPYMSCHWDNAKIVTEVPMDKIKTITPKDLYAFGFIDGNSSTFA